jgi:Zn-dependent protease with chaperone function
VAEKVKLESISSQSFEHEADRAALEALKKTIGFDQLMRAVSRLGADQIWRVMNESSNIRLSERQVGSVYRIHREVAATLDLDPAPPIYLAHDVRLNAYTSGVDSPFIVVTSGLVEGLSDEEIAHVIGHEMGHILAGHVLYGMVARSLGLILTLIAGDATPVGSILKLSLMSALAYWQRCAELTADRAGLLACQNPRVALAVEMKLASGPGSRIARELDLDTFMEQAREFETLDGGKLEQMWRAVLENDRSHPWPVVRARELDRWVRVGHYQRILDGAYQRRARSVIADGARHDEPADETAQLAAVAELAVVAALARTYGVHVAPRIPEAALHLALGAYVENLEPGERVVALYDPSLSGHGDRGVLLTDRRVWTSAQPRRGAYFRDIDRLQLVGGGLLSSVGIDVEGLELRFHTKSVRDAFADALSEGARVFRGAVPERTGS